MPELQSIAQTTATTSRGSGRIYADRAQLHELSLHWHEYAARGKKGMEELHGKLIAYFNDLCRRG